MIDFKGTIKHCFIPQFIFNIIENSKSLFCKQKKYDKLKERSLPTMDELLKKYGYKDRTELINYMICRAGEISFDTLEPAFKMEVVGGRWGNVITKDHDNLLPFQIKRLENMHRQNSQIEEFLMVLHDEEYEKCLKTKRVRI